MRRDPSVTHEEATITFETVTQVSRFELDDTSPLALPGTEEDLCQRILADSDVLEDGFQATMTERETAAGAVDIYGTDADGTPTVVELKHRRVGPRGWAIESLRRSARP